MPTKNYTQVLIDGKIYTLGGAEDESYLQRTASYVNEKIMTIRRLPGFSKQGADYQAAMIELNIADDYFKARERAEEAERQNSNMEKESYSLKHELVSTQMKLEAVLKDLEERQKQLREMTRKADRLEGQLKEAEKREQEAAAQQVAAQEAAAAREAAAAQMTLRVTEAEADITVPVQEKADLKPEAETADSGPQETGNTAQRAETTGQTAEPPAQSPENPQKQPLSQAELARRALASARYANHQHKGHRLG